MGISGSMFSGYAPSYNNNNQTLSMIMQLLEKAGSTIGSAVKTGQQNNVANTFMQQANSGVNAPHAGLVSAGVNPATGAANSIPAGTVTTGTAPLYPTGASGQLGGTPELSMAMQLQKQQAAQQGQNAQMALRQQQLQNMQQDYKYKEIYGTANP